MDEAEAVRNAHAWCGHGLASWTLILAALEEQFRV